VRKVANATLSYTLLLGGGFVCILGTNARTCLFASHLGYAYAVGGHFANVGYRGAPEDLKHPDSVKDRKSLKIPTCVG